MCYPFFKAPDANTYNWFLGMYDTCSYISSQGRQMFGVCCPNPATPSEVPGSASTEKATISQGSTPQKPNKPSTVTNQTSIYYPQTLNWPPPLPTHPPHHTIPPLPTHPPSPGYPVAPTTSSAPNKPTASMPTSYKPSVTAPAIKPTSTKAPSGAKPITASCGAKNGYEDQERIVGGHNADPNEWPWIAGLFVGGRQFCGGSLIDKQHILSAAHCVAHMSSWDVARLTVRLGDHNIKTSSEVRHVEKRVKRVVRHRGFDSRTLYNDIAILTLDSPVEFSHQIRPICLPSGNNDHAGKTGTVIGWGSLRESGPQPAVLQEVNIPIWNNRDCKLKYGPAAPGGIVEHMICAGRANRDSCSGDSGGPLMVKNGKWTQIGIVSWGIGCGKGQYPGVYTRVEKFLPWIYKNLK
ncbi:unnamed protein product [Acanthoscelides obtectus]|nr:unnamed protein product [Acanthoscelides obtectus]CAK1627717.1 hypothetical protein AOBTE_LOCUS4788 [Acanthoscelides obtectus]